MEYIVSLYTSLGGKKITLGSDAHQVSRHKNGFDKVIATLKAVGIDSVCVFVDRKNKLCYCNSTLIHGGAECVQVNKIQI